ncbi:RNA polymerase sigma factor [Sungkyunkwania multivorans]|uniref:RNA polymerase sigma factor n=1 Tax=Sungkyunkwania multivorans TaxID=1173618 RepID=A0ABW3CXR8_9FLAO
MSKEEQFTKLIKDNEGIIFKITTVYTDNREDQQDLYQDIVFQLWKYFESFRNESKISTWMYRVALNTAITRIKREKRNGQKVAIDKVVLQQTEYYDADFEERLKLMYDHIQMLNDLEKGLILLLLEGKKYEEMAAITGLTTSNVGTRISRIKQKLKSTVTEKQAR